MAGQRCIESYMGGEGWELLVVGRSFDDRAIGGGRGVTSAGTRTVALFRAGA